MSNLDFRVIRVNDPTRLVSITSKSRDAYILGLDKLCQKVIHALFTLTGEDPYDRDYGCQLVKLFKTAPLPSQLNAVERAVTEAVNKAQRDIIRIQSANKLNQLKDQSATLKKLELLSVAPNYETYSWEIHVRVHAENGEFADIELPDGFVGPN